MTDPARPDEQVLDEQPIAVTLTLTPSEWAELEDGLATTEALTLEQAELWKGRAREARYRREAQRTSAVLDKLQTALKEAHVFS